jgi:hypothetical protein
MTCCAAEPGTDESDSEGVYLDEGAYDLDEISSDVGVNPDDIEPDVSTDGEYVLPRLPFLEPCTDLCALCPLVALKRSMIPVKPKLARNDHMMTP